MYILPTIAVTVSTFIASGANVPASLIVMGIALYLTYDVKDTK